MTTPSTAPFHHRLPEAAFDVVVMAASMGGLSALRTILAGLPANFPAAVLIQTHLNPTGSSMLVELLQPHASLPVAWAADGANLRPGSVVVAPPGQHVRVHPEGQLRLTFWEQLGYIRPHADGLFESVAASFQARALGVVLTGYLDDGAQGAQAIHRRGGRVLVQDPVNAEAPDMPQATLRTGCVDFVLPLAAMPAAITALVMVRGVAQFFVVPPAPRIQHYREALRTWGV